MEQTFAKKLLVVVLAAVVVTGCSKKNAADSGAASSDATSGGSGDAAATSSSAAGAGNGVYFDYDRFDIRADAATTLDASAATLSGSTTPVRLEGNADERGTTEYNMALGEKRAKAVRDYLVSKGIAADRIEAVSYGEEQPVCKEQSEDCYQQNRRVDVK